MRRKFKSIICLVLAMVMMSSLFVVSASAANTEEENVRIVFHKPDGWGDNLYIHLWNAGSEDTQWPGVAMTKNSDGTYTYTSSSITSCNFVVNDGNGNQTADLYAEGYVGVKDNCVFDMSDEDVYLFFEKPANWSSDVRAYYYTNDNNEVALTDWPGVAMHKNYGEDTYYLTIDDMADIRVIFTDGNNQYPSANQPGIPVTAGNELIYQDGKYTTAENIWVTVKEDVNYALVGEEFKVTISMNIGSDFPLVFDDENGNSVNPTRVVENEYNGKSVRDYYFVFNETGDKTIKINYIYASSCTYTGTDFDVSVISSKGQYYVDCDKETLSVGETFTLTSNSHGEIGYRFYDEDGNLINYDSISYNYETGESLYHFTANKIGKGQKIYMYSHYYHNPGYETYTGRYVTIDVWQNAI